jgi:hypothetical protein
MITAMDVDHPEDDQRWDRSARGETEIERLDRNWSNLLQELRVVQTGVQLLTGFLLTLPFQQRFDVLNQQMRIAYLVTVGCSVGATVLLIARLAVTGCCSGGIDCRCWCRPRTGAPRRAGAARFGADRGDGHRLRLGGRARRGGDRGGVCVGDVCVLLVGAAPVAAHPRHVVICRVKNFCV